MENIKKKVLRIVVNSTGHCDGYPRIEQTLHDLLRLLYVFVCNFSKDIIKTFLKFIVVILTFSICNLNTEK